MHFIDGKTEAPTGETLGQGRTVSKHRGQYWNLVSYFSNLIRKERVKKERKYGGYVFFCFESSIIFPPDMFLGFWCEILSRQVSHPMKCLCLHSASPFRSMTVAEQGHFHPARSRSGLMKTKTIVYLSRSAGLLGPTEASATFPVKILKWAKSLKMILTKTHVNWEAWDDTLLNFLCLYLSHSFLPPESSSLVL